MDQNQGIKVSRDEEIKNNYYESQNSSQSWKHSGKVQDFISFHDCNENTTIINILILYIILYILYIY